MLDRLRDVAELVDDELERLLRVAHPAEDEDHLGVQQLRLRASPATSPPGLAIYGITVGNIAAGTRCKWHRSAPRL